MACHDCFLVYYIGEAVFDVCVGHCGRCFMIIIIQMSYAVFEGLKSLHMNAEVQNYKWLSMQMKSTAHSLDRLHLAKSSTNAD